MNNIPPDAYIGRGIHEIVGSLAATVEQHLTHVFRTGKVLYNLELCGRLGKNLCTGRWVATYFPIADERGRVMRVGAVVIEQPEPRTCLGEKCILPREASPIGRHSPPPPRLVERVASSSACVSADGKQGLAPSLSPREKDVLRLLASGSSNKEVSVILEISVKTVEEYRSRLKFKLQTKSLADLIRYAILHQITGPQ
jgi:DNA-binding CsgD family transcriptional regulator